MSAELENARVSPFLEIEKFSIVRGKRWKMLEASFIFDEEGLAARFFLFFLTSISVAFGARTLAWRSLFPKFNPTNILTYSDIHLDFTLSTTTVSTIFAIIARTGLFRQVTVILDSFVRVKFSFSGKSRRHSLDLEAVRCHDAINKSRISDTLVGRFERLTSSKFPSQKHEFLANLQPAIGFSFSTFLKQNKKKFWFPQLVKNLTFRGTFWPILVKLGYVWAKNYNFVHARKTYKKVPKTVKLWRIILFAAVCIRCSIKSIKSTS